MLKSLRIIFLLNVATAQYYGVREFRFIKVNASAVSMTAHLIQHREFPSTRFVWKYTEVSCHDNRTGSKLYEEELNAGGNILSHTFGPLLGGKWYTFQVTFMSKREHRLGYAEEYYYLEPRPVKEFTVFKDTNNGNQARVEFLPHHHSLYEDLSISCRSVCNLSNREVINIPNNTTHNFVNLTYQYPISVYSKSVDTAKLGSRKRNQTFGENIILSVLGHGDFWISIDLGDTYEDIVAMEISTTEDSISASNLALNKPYAYHLGPKRGDIAASRYDKAVNGILSGDNELVVNTQNQLINGWAILLGPLSDIGKVVLYQSCQDHQCDANLKEVTIATQNTYVFIRPNFRSFTSVEWMNQSYRHDPYGAFGVTKFFHPVETNYIYISSFKKLYLTELQAYKKDDFNVALGKRAIQSSTPEMNSSAENAVNGIIKAGDYSSTNLESDVWWLVELGKLYDIGHIVLYNRLGQCGRVPCKNQLKEITLFTSANRFQETGAPHSANRKWLNQTYRHEPYDEIGVIEFGDTVSAMQVALYTNSSTVLSLREVQIFQKERRKSTVDVRSTTLQQISDNICSLYNTRWITRLRYKLLDPKSTILFDPHFSARSIALCGYLRRPMNITEISIHRSGKARTEATVDIRGLKSNKDGDVKECSLVSRQSGFALSDNLGLMIFGPASPKIDFETPKVKESKEGPYLLVETKLTENDTAREGISLSLTITNLASQQTILVHSRLNEPFEVRNIQFGIRHSMVLTKSFIYDNMRIQGEPGNSITVGLAPLPPEKLLFNAFEDVIVMKWKVHSQNHYQSVFTNCSVDNSTIFKIDAQADSFIWKNLQADTRYTFDVWTYSDTVDINSTRLTVYRSFQISKNATSAYAALTYTAIAFVILLATVGVIIASLRPKGIKVLTEIWNKKLIACGGKDSQPVARTMINDSTILEPTRFEPDNPEFSNRADKP